VLPKHQRTYEFRCPVHGFVTLTDWEREIISQSPYQRLRRIRQLGWTDHVYPGAAHSRFEHSLGVMHVATAMFDGIVNSSRDVLERELTFDKAGIERDRILVRLTALLHDVGHCPFSHAAEELFPRVSSEEEAPRFEHEEYSAAIIRERLRDAIEQHPTNDNYKIRADDIANLLEGSTESGRSLVWRDIITGQMDADRVDYLLRDSLHSGVEYGKFDWRRLIGCLALVTSDAERGFRLGVTEGGLHAAEALVLARYFMFTQVYFHKTRVAFDYHLQHALGEMLPNGHFPRPTGDELDDFLKWDDWRVVGNLASGAGGEHGQRLCQRTHFREVFHTPETPTRQDLARFERVCDDLGKMLRVVVPAEKSWYKVDETDIQVQSDNPGNQVFPLSKLSSAIARLKPIRKRMAYCSPEDQERAADVVANRVGSKRKGTKQ
jgi:HD superfamily phosphohydrolase